MKILNKCRAIKNKVLIDKIKLTQGYFTIFLFFSVRISEYQTNMSSSPLPHSMIKNN